MTILIPFPKILTFQQESNHRAITYQVLNVKVNYAVNGNGLFESLRFVVYKMPKKNNECTKQAWGPRPWLFVCTALLGERSQCSTVSRIFVGTDVLVCSVGINGTLEIDLILTRWCCLNFLDLGCQASSTVLLTDLKSVDNKLVLNPGRFTSQSQSPA